MEKVVKLTRRRLTPRDKANITLLRYGDLEDHAQVVESIKGIARTLSLQYHTVFRFLERLQRDGPRALADHRYRGKPPAVIVSRDVEMLLLSDTYMRRWAPLTLR